ncbi:hypothetical protein BH10ACI1_BH10ACI1_13680 [soil metagenome]
MRKILFVLVCYTVFLVSVSAQRQTRPRVVVTPTPSTVQTDNSNSTRNAPVLVGRTNPNTQTTTNTENTTVEEDDEIIKVETNLVTMPVSVLDRDGRFISGLQQKDFQIFENGIQQKLEYFQTVEQPFTVVLLIDVSPSTQYRIDEIQDAAIMFVNQLRPNDRVVVIAFDERVHVLSPATNNRNVLKNAIREANFGDGTSLYEAVDYAINQELRRIEGRKAVVLFTDGVDTTSRRANYQSTVSQAEELDALIYPIRYNTMEYMTGGGNTGGGNRRTGGGTLGGIIGVILGGGNVQIGGANRGGTRQEYEIAQRYLQELAQKSGGRNFEADSTNNLTAAFVGIAEELRRQYSVGYYPDKVGQKGERRSIRIRVMRPNVVVRAKTSYVVGQGR